MRTTRSTLAIAAISAVALLGASACGDDSSSESSPATTTSSPAMQTNEPTADAAAADLVGPGCDDYAAQLPSGAGSVSGMAQDPVTVAASNNPMLTTLVKAVSGQLNPQVNLVDTLNGGEFTVFAPVDAAFATIDPATIESLGTDADTLTTILTYHVVPGRIAPSDIAGEQTTVQGSKVNVTRSGDDIKVGNASVICGGVSTANATVYMIDGVLMPPA
ncbi:fasciclin domain-containing protein [Nocardia cyriacigeorgica]|uniref:fasciclin domain-containing protein n=1 Tax=Nocardia cyriacigeorgica TaxID=135487 RepID=UPI0005653130|nr:fasciclin domain-containing protein [Nocardia cyriacigeorgica]TLF54181.1 fasciclin domain-containing protein [Nocardia cyriacigeorgica]